MDALLQSRAEESVQEFAVQATTVEELNELMRLMLIAFQSSPMRSLPADSRVGCRWEEVAASR